MKMSTKSRYALRLMLDIAANTSGDGVVSLKDIAERQEVSVKYLEQIVMQLTRVGLLISSRGSQGGYRLARNAADCTVGEIIRATEGNVAPVACLAGTPNQCRRADKCETLGFWTGLHAVINDYIDGVTLADVAAGNGTKSGAGF